MPSITPYQKFGKPTPNTDASLRVHVWVMTDTITGLAHKFYGDLLLWHVIADRNEIVDVRQIEPGTELIIPRRELEKGRYESR